MPSDRATPTGTAVLPAGLALGLALHRWPPRPTEQPA